MKKKDQPRRVEGNCDASLLIALLSVTSKDIPRSNEIEGHIICLERGDLSCKLGTVMKEIQRRKRADPKTKTSIDAIPDLSI